jgi:hypothetical protein
LDTKVDKGAGCVHGGGQLQEDRKANRDFLGAILSIYLMIHTLGRGAMTQWLKLAVEILQCTVPKMEIATERAIQEALMIGYI